MTDHAWVQLSGQMADAGFPVVCQLGKFKMPGLSDGVFLYEVQGQMGRMLSRKFGPPRTVVCFSMFGCCVCGGCSVCVCVCIYVFFFLCVYRKGRQVCNSRNTHAPSHVHHHTRTPNNTDHKNSRGHRL